MSSYVGNAPVAPETDNIPVNPLNLVRRFWAGFHTFIIIALVFSLLGIGVGVKAAQQFYTDKLDEITTTGAMLHKKKVFLVQPKL